MLERQVYGPDQEDMKSQYCPLRRVALLAHGQERRWLIRGVREGNK